jgi:hypothetical protein
MMTVSSFFGKKISSRKRVICQKINDGAQHVAKMAEECMIMMQDLVKKRQLTLNAINPEVAKVSKVISFAGDGGLPHYYSWKQDVLAAAAEIGMPVNNEGSYMHVEGEARNRVDSKLAAVSRPVVQKTS